MKRVKAEKPFETEAAMCARFISKLPQGWTAYAETAGWDILLVRNCDGFQIGIEAKLKLNLHVFAQAIEDGWVYHVTSPGPDCRAVLVPATEANGVFDTVGGYIGLTVIRVYPEKKYQVHAFEPLLPDETKRSYSGGADWHELAPTTRCRLPEYVPDVAAGASAPVQLTKWKIAALKLLFTLETRGHLTREDFKHIGVDHRRWLSSDWLQTSDGVYIAFKMPDFKGQHPKVYAEIAADADKWMRPAGLIPPKKTKVLEQVALL